MITVSDYYKKNIPTLSNSKEVDISLDRTFVFPEDGIYIGDFTSITGHKVLRLYHWKKRMGYVFLRLLRLGRTYAIPCR